MTRPRLLVVLAVFAGLAVGAFSLSASPVGPALQRVVVQTGGGLQGTGTNASNLSLLRSCSSGQALIWNGSSWACGAVGASPTTPEFLGGGDGDLHFDGSSVVAGLTPASNVYTLTNDIAPHDVLIDSGVTVKTANFAILGTGTLTDNGTVSNDGNTAANFSGGAATSGQRFGATIAGGGGGGASSSNVPRGYAVTRSANTGTGGAGHAGNAGAAGSCQGGSGGADSSGVAGSSGGSIAITTQAADPPRFWYATNNAGSPYTFGSGGGQGGNSPGQSGGGGAGGGYLLLTFTTITGTGAIHARGGGGSTAVNSGGGGGGGGGGGMVRIYYAHRAGSLTIDANGGAAGNGLGGGGVGGAGGSCVVSLINMSGDGT